MKGTVYGIGVGPGDPELLTIKAVNILKKIDIVAIPQTKDDKDSIAFNIAKPYMKSSVEIVKLTFPMSLDINIREEARAKNAQIIKKLAFEGKNIAFLTLGDPLFYSTFIYLLNHFDGAVDVKSIPGVTAFSSIASNANFPIVKGDESLCVICDFVKSEMDGYLEKFNTIIFMKVSSYAKEIGEFIQRNNLTSNFIMASNFGLPDERISSDVNVLLNEKIDYLTTIILRK